jgi:hypothetical protein
MYVVVVVVVGLGSNGQIDAVPDVVVVVSFVRSPIDNIAAVSPIYARPLAISKSKSLTIFAGLEEPTFFVLPYVTDDDTIPVPLARTSLVYTPALITSPVERGASSGVPTFEAPITISTLSNIDPSHSTYLVTIEFSVSGVDGGRCAAAAKPTIARIKIVAIANFFIFTYLSKN